MSQKTDLNISPYYDDFDRSKDFYKVLFKPGFPVQARELTTLQSILQNQIEYFGKNIFKEGSMVLPGAITFDNQFSAVKIDATNLGVDVSLYIKNFIGKKVTGQLSGVSASIQDVALTTDSDIVEYVTLYVKYSDSGDDYISDTFQDGESLFASENVTYGNTTINAGTAFATLIGEGATSTGSSASIDNGIYFVRGIFANVNKQTLILDYYTNTPSYRVGLKIEEKIINAKDDDSLYDNAKGFTNYAAPGADRFKLSLTLTKKSLTDFNDTDFIELLRVDDGKIKKIEDKTVYNVIRDYIAERTYDESGHYSVDSFDVKILESLNDRLGNDGLFLEGETTEEGNEPTDDLMCVQVSPGKAYVAGYDVETVSAQVIDVDKPRDTEIVTNSNIPFEMGHLLRVNNVSGAVAENVVVTLSDRPKGSTPSGIGSARVYAFNLTDAAYSSAETQWDLYLYDIQTQTTLTVNRTIVAGEVPVTSFVKGKSSGASGFAQDAGSGTSIILRQTSGTFAVNEQLVINGIDSPLTVTAASVFGIQDIKSISSGSGGGFPAFSADSVLSKRKLPNGITEVNISGSTMTSPGKQFSGIKAGDIIRYQQGSGDETFNRVSAVSSDLSSLTLAGLSTVAGVFDGGIGIGTFRVELGIPELKNNGQGYLYAKLPEPNISSINFTDSTLALSQQITGETTNGDGVLAFDLTAVTGITSAFFEAFDQERYSVHYTGGGIGTVTSDAFTLNTTTNTVTIRGLEASESSVVVNTTLKKNGIKSKIKEYTRSAIKVVNLSKLAQSGSATSTSVDDGLTSNDFFGLRVQDSEISLNFPDVAKVLAVYESTDTSDPVLDRIEFSSISNVDSDAIVGEEIVGSTSGAIARVVLNTGTTPSVPTNNLGIVYLNKEKFAVGEEVTFGESNITSTVQSITIGKYKNITNNYTLDKGQRDEYYDYSRIVRKNDVEPSRRLLIVFDHYTVPANDDGDVFTVLSYDADRFKDDIPVIGSDNVRASDTLDFRPRVSEFTVTTSSPFDFDSRSFGTEPKFNLKPGESSLVGFEFYLPRIDKLFLDKFGNFIVSKGVPSKDPKEPIVNDTDLMELATINLPAYLYDTDDASISLFDNRRYTMRDIGKLEDRIENLERTTTLSLLEVKTESLRIEDADGNNRFKSGFFVDDFNDTTLLDSDLTTAEVSGGELKPRVFRNSIQMRPLPATEIAESELDLSTDFALLDSNVQKTGKSITLKYDSVGWIEQPLATRVENVNPFHVVEYIGFVKLEPASDVWTRTIRIPGRSVTVDIGGRGFVRGIVGTRTRDVIVSSGVERYIRSRNVSVFARNLKPLSIHYQFLDNHSNVDFIPKLLEIATDSTLENYGSSGVFSVGETVIGYFGGERIIRFRLANSNHKEGAFNSPSVTYNINPYAKSENISSAYSQSSKVLNIDIAALSAEAQGAFFGYVLKGAKLVGQTSGAVAYVKDNRIITDNYGDVLGSFFIRNPHTNPAPDVRILTGKKTYTLSTSISNEKPLPGSKLTSSAVGTYTANGIFQVRQTVTERLSARFDPLAQSFVVGKDIDAPDLNGQSDDDNGAFLTAVDIFFANKPSTNEPVMVQIRTVELGVPTLKVVGEPKTLLPDDITTSKTGEVATTATFDYPIYLAPGREYAVVLLAPTTDQYEVWIAKMGEKTANTQSLPNAESVVYSKQFAMGSLFKSQNGSTWTPAQELDLKFKLYKAKFTSTSGIAHFGNPPLNESNGYSQPLDENPLVAVPKTLTLGITTVVSDSPLIDILTEGRRIAGTNSIDGHGNIVSIGSSVSTLGINDGGTNYTNQSDVGTTTLVGSGSGLKFDITTTNGAVTNTTITSRGNGYAVGDVVTIDNSDGSFTGRDARITVEAIGGIDTLYLTNVQGEKGSSKAFQVGAGLSYYSTDSTIVSAASTTIVDRTSEGTGSNSGNFLQVNHFAHGMYGNTNQLELSGIESDVAPTTLSSELLSTETTTIEVDDSTNFTTFEGLTVNATNKGYVKIGDEIIEYTAASSNQLTINARGFGDTITQTHDVNSEVMKYEFAGVSLRRINGVTHDISDTGIEANRYFIEIDRGSTNGLDRSADTSTGPQLSFVNVVGGGDNVVGSENILFNELTPRFDVTAPGKLTSVSATVRTTSGTSIDGSEASFQRLNTVDNVLLNEPNLVDSTRIVCSRVNELNQSVFSTVPGRRSFTAALTLNTEDENLSPIIYLDDSTVVFSNNNLNSPVSDYSTDANVKSFINDPHTAAYVSKVISLAQPASSLKVLLTAYRHQSADIRVLYSLVRDDSAAVEQEFELFPGYDNLTSPLDGELKVVNAANNNGRPDVRVPDSEENQFLEYEFTANNLGEFSGYRIKICLSGTNQAEPPRIRDLRTIAIR